MLLKSLYLYNFRLYPEAHFDFAPHINMICGRNAVGKTSIVEAIHFLASGHSFRTHHASHLIRSGAEYFYIEARFVKHGVEQTLKMSYNGRERKIFLNATRYPSSASLVGLLLSVIFSPDDIDLIKGTPHGRRFYLDAQLSQADPLYLYHSTRYTRAMRQRNCLLKGKNLATIHSFEQEMAQSAAYLLQKRLQLLDELKPMATDYYQAIACEEDNLSLLYRQAAKFSETSSSYTEKYLELYEKNRFRELAQATTLVGPHKDDLTILIGDKEAKHFASEGQMRTTAAALRLAEWCRLQKVSGEIPLMLLDDVATSLDQRRATQLFSLLGSLGQIFVTTSKPPEGILGGDNTKIITLE